MPLPPKPNSLAENIANTLTLFDPFWNAGKNWQKDAPVQRPARCQVVVGREAFETLQGIEAQFQGPSAGWKALLLAPPGFYSQQWVQPSQQSQIAALLPTIVQLERDMWVMLLPDNHVVLVLYHPATEGLVKVVYGLAALLVGPERAPQTAVKIADLNGNAKMLNSWAKECGARLHATQIKAAQLAQQHQLEVVQKIFAGSMLNVQLRSQRTTPLVMVVEDDPSTGLLLETLLGSTAQVVVAKDAAMAAQLYARHMPELVFLDIGLPDVSGLELLRLITTTDATAQVVMLTANATKENLVVATQAGAQGFLAKPFTRDKLQQAIQRACPNRK